MIAAPRFLENQTFSLLQVLGSRTHMLESRKTTNNHVYCTCLVEDHYVRGARIARSMEGAPGRRTPSWYES